MDGLSNAAGVCGIASIVVQMGASVVKLCRFWDSVNEAPNHIRAISQDLRFVSVILKDLAEDLQPCETNTTLEAILKQGEPLVLALCAILDQVQPCLASTKRAVRKWAALKSVLRSERIRAFQEQLAALKSTLQLALLIRAR